MLLILIGILFIFSQAQATKYFVVEVSATSVTDDVRRSVRELTKNAVIESGGELTNGPGNADYLLHPKLIRLGRALIVTVDKIQENKIIYSAKSKSSSIEELDQIILKSVRAAMKSTRTQDDIRVGEVSEKEQNQLQQRRKTLNLNYYAIGPHSLVNLKTEGLGVHIAYGRLWEVNLRSAIRMGIEATIDGRKDTASVAAATLGASYYLNTADISPYVFADFGYGLAASKKVNKSSNGFSAGGGMGLIFFRTSEAQMDLSLRYLAILDENEKGTPASMGLRLGILY